MCDNNNNSNNNNNNNINNTNTNNNLFFNNQSRRARSNLAQQDEQQVGGEPQLQLAAQAAAMMAATMAAQQLLASAAAIFGIDLAALTDQSAAGASNQAAGQTSDHLLAAAAAFLTQNQLVPEDLTVNNSASSTPAPVTSPTPYQQYHQQHQLQLQHQQQQHQHQQQQQQQQQSQQNHHHRHHHLLGGHHHHSSIQTQQQLLATKGFNPMAVVVGSGQQTEILTPTHLRKAKLMFFYVRYPNSSTLKECFRDVRFNKNNTAQLVKWFSNFREFYYIQMEKFARDAVADKRIQCKEDIVVNFEHELINQLNNHYNKNRHIELPEVFRQVVEETLRHFFDAIHNKRDQEQSWKKAIYKLIARLDQEVPEAFKTDAFNEYLE